MGFKISWLVLSIMFLLLPFTGTIAQDEPLTTLEGHTGPVFSLAFSPDSKTLVSGGSGEDYTARVWDYETAQQKFVLEGHSAQIAAVGFSPNGSQILTAGYEHIVNVWDANSGELVDSITETNTGESLNVENLNAFFSEDGNLLAYGTDSGVGLYIFDMTSHTQIDLSADKGALSDGVSTIDIGYNEDWGYIVAGADYDGAIHIISVENSQEIQVLQPEEPVFFYSAMRFSPDGKRLAAVNDEPAIIDVWDIETNTIISSIAGHTPNTDGSLGVYGLAWSPEGACLASVSYDQTLRIWDVFAAQEVANYPLETGAGVVAWSPDGHQIATGDLNGVITIWEVACDRQPVPIASEEVESVTLVPLSEIPPLTQTITATSDVGTLTIGYPEGWIALDVLQGELELFVANKSPENITDS
jgi:WD40 repeat protein